MLTGYVTRIVAAACLVLAAAGTARAGDYPPLHHVTDEGQVELCLTADGIVGNGFWVSSVPSCTYPAGSTNEHLYLGGLWVGAVLPSGEHRVSTSDQDANNLSVAEALNEFTVTLNAVNQPDFRVMSSRQSDELYSPYALAPYHLECRFQDTFAGPDGHTPLGIVVTLRALAWDDLTFGEFVILDYTVTNVSGAELRDVHVGFFNDTTVGNTELTNPYDPFAPLRWNYYDDLNGAWRPGDFASDPTLWMMHEHDGDGDQGLATSWVGCRLLGTVPAVAAPFGRPPVSYNCWSYNRVPARDDWYENPSAPGSMLPGKYQLMGNGDFDVGVTPDGDFTVMGNRVGLLSTGPFPVLAAGNSVSVTFALTLGADADALRRNSRLAKLVYDYGYQPTVSGAEDLPGRRPTVGPAVPNPFNPCTRVTFTLPAAGPVLLTVHDLQGRRVATLFAGQADAGSHPAEWDGRDGSGRLAAAGSYLVRLEGPGGVAVTKVVLAK